MAALPRKAQDRIWTRDFALLWVTTFASYASVYLLLPTLPGYLTGLGGGEAHIGLLFGIFSATALLVRPFAGRLSDQAGCRASVLAGTALMCVATFGYRFTGSIPAVMALRVVNGLGWGGLTAAATTLAGNLAPPARRGEALGVFGMAGSLALASSPAIGLRIAAAVGYPPLFLLAGTMAGLAVALTALIREPRAPAEPRPAGSPPESMLDRFVSRPALGPALVLFCHSATYGAVVSFVPLLATRRGIGDSGAFFAVYAVTLFLLRSVAGRVFDRYGPGTAIVPGLVVATVAMLLLAGAASPALLLTAAPVYAVAVAFVQPPSLAWAAGRTPRHQRGVGMATMIAAQDLGISLGSTVWGVIGQAAGLGALFVSAASMGPAGLLVYRWVSRGTAPPGARAASSAGAAAPRP